MATAAAPTAAMVKLTGFRAAKSGPKIVMIGPIARSKGPKAAVIPAIAEPHFKTSGLVLAIFRVSLVISFTRSVANSSNPLSAMAKANSWRADFN